MSSDPTTSFSTKLDELRRGIPGAQESFVNEYGPYVRRSLRIRLRRSMLQAAADSADLCQSVMASFLLRLAAGQFELTNESDMRRLLAAIANKKFLMFQRYELASKRDRRMTKPLDHDPVNKNRPDGIANDRVSLIQNIDEKLKQLLTVDEYQLFELRRNGISWNQIAAGHQVDSAVLRKRYSRALTRVAIKLGIDWDLNNP